MIKVLIADDQAIARQGLTAILEPETDINVVGVAINGNDVLKKVPSLKPDLVLMDLQMPELNGIEATKRLKAEYPKLSVLVLTTYFTDDWLESALREGADGYLLKDASSIEILSAIRGTVKGKTFLDPSVAGKIIKQLQDLPIKDETALIEPLTDKENIVLSYLSEGLSNMDIAKKLKLSEGTIRNHVSVIFHKLDVDTRTKAAVKAIRLGLVK